MNKIYSNVGTRNATVEVMDDGNLKYRIYDPELGAERNLVYTPKLIRDLSRILDENSIGDV